MELFKEQIDGSVAVYTSAEIHYNRQEGMKGVLGRWI